MKTIQEELREAVEDLRKPKQKGYDLPYPELQNKLKGLRKGELTLLTAGGAGRGPISRLVLEAVDKIDDLEKTVELLRESAQALTCAKAEPIAWLLHFKPPHGATYSYKEEITFLKSHAETMSKYALRVIPLYTHPPKQEQPPKVAPTVAIDERAEFEKWANENKGGETLQLGGGGTYPNPFANAAFEAWQARAKLSAPVVPDAKDELDHDGIWTNSDVAEQRYIQGWNDCRAAMLKGEK